MQIPILSGIYTDSSPSLRTSYPVNLCPVIEPSGVSDSYLKPADGIIAEGTGPGTGRGGILWNDVLYRVMGSKLVSIDSAGTVTTLGDVGNDGGQVSFDYSFDRLAVGSNGNLFYWDGTTLTQVTDSDLGTVKDVIWVDGYFMTTDGESLVVTELADPTNVDPLKYGSSEIDPDPVLALVKIRNEPHAINRYTIEVFRNIGGTNFPFQRITGAQIQKGAVGTHAVAILNDAVAFLGSGRGEAPSVYIGANGQVKKLANREIDKLLSYYTEAQLSAALVESRTNEATQMLYIHLPDQTLVYNATASAAAGVPVWFILSSSYQQTRSQYRAQNIIWAYSKWCACDPQSSAIGYLTDEEGGHWGSPVRWEFGTQIFYNDAQSLIFNQMELVTLTGRVKLGETPTISTAYSLDGSVWSTNRDIEAGQIGDRLKRLVWFRQGLMRNMRVQKFFGISDAHLTFLRLDAKVEALSA